MSYGEDGIGVVRVSTPRCQNGPLRCGVKGHDHDLGTDVPTAYLPHSCDEWVIGGRAEVEAMIADLQSALVRLALED